MPTVPAEPQGSVPAELQGRKGDMLAGHITLPIIAVMIYGIYKFIELGVSFDHYLYTYTPLFGGVAAIAGLGTYYLIVAMPRKISWKNLLLLLGLLPYLFSLYVVGFLGAYMIYRGVVEQFSIWSIVAGLFWVVIGHRIVYQFYLMTEIVRRHDEASKVAHAVEPMT